MAIFSLFAECRAPLQKHRILNYDSDSELDENITDDLIILNSARSDSRRLSTRRPSKVKEEAKVATMAMVADLREGMVSCFVTADHEYTNTPAVNTIIVLDIV